MPQETGSDWAWMLQRVGAFGPPDGPADSRAMTAVDPLVLAGLQELAEVTGGRRAAAAAWKGREVPEEGRLGCVEVGLRAPPGSG